MLQDVTFSLNLVGVRYMEKICTNYHRDDLLSMDGKSTMEAMKVRDWLRAEPPLYGIVKVNVNDFISLAHGKVGVGRFLRILAGELCYNSVRRSPQFPQFTLSFW